MRKILFLILINTIFIFASMNIESLKLAAKKGDVGAIMKLALMYETGRGVEKDIQKAIRYYRQASELGSEDAKLSISLLELEQNLDKRSVSLENKIEIKTKSGLRYELKVSDLKDVIKRAKNGDKDAFFTLATIYDNGYGDIKADKKRAIALYKKAASLGSKKAKHILLLLQQ